MKVQASYDLNEDQLLAIGMAETGFFVRATQKQARAYLEIVGIVEVDIITEVVIEARKRAADEIKGKINE